MRKKQEKYRIVKNKYGFYKLQYKLWFFWLNVSDYYKSGDGYWKPIDLFFDTIHKAKAKKKELQQKQYTRDLQNHLIKQKKHNSYKEVK